VPPPGTLGIGGKAAFLAACTAASAFGAEVNTRGAADAPVARASIAPIVSGGREATQGRGGGPPRARGNLSPPRSFGQTLSQRPCLEASNDRRRGRGKRLAGPAH
jgi:hypothetical protein